MSSGPSVLLVLLVLAAGATWLLVKNTAAKRREKQLARAYEKQMFRNKLCIEHAEIIGNRLLAIDRVNRKLLVIDQNLGLEYCISLLSVGGTRVAEESDAQGRIQKILLVLRHRRQDRTERICFYDASADRLGDLPFFSRRAWHWKHRIDIHLQPGIHCSGQEILY